MNLGGGDVDRGLELTHVWTEEGVCSMIFLTFYTSLLPLGVKEMFFDLYKEYEEYDYGFHLS